MCIFVWQSSGDQDLCFSLFLYFLYHSLRAWYSGEVFNSEAVVWLMASVCGNLNLLSFLLSSSCRTPGNENLIGLDP